MIELFTYKAHIEDVVDGDTLDLSVDLGFGVFYKMRVRLYGVNTPETRTTDDIEKAAGLAAKEFTKTWAKNNPEIFVKTIKDKKEKFGRILAEIFPDSTGADSLNKQLISNNLAKEYYGGKRE